MSEPITPELLAEMMAKTGEPEEIIREAWDALQCCGDEEDFDE